MQCACTSTVLIRLPAMTTSQRRWAWVWTPPPELGPAPAEISQSTKAMLAVPLVGASVLIDICISSRWVDLAFGASLLLLCVCVVLQSLFLKDGARARFAGGQSADRCARRPRPRRAQGHSRPDIPALKP